MAKTVATAPKVIQDKEFNGGAALLLEDWKIFEVKNFDGLGSIFFEKWEGSAGVILTAVFSADGSEIEKLSPVTVGTIFAGRRDRSILASKIWNFKDKNIFIKFGMLDLEKFKFEGKMFSDLVDHSDLMFDLFTGKNEEVAMIDVAKQGYDGFSLRAVVAPTSTYAARLYVYIYPYNKKAMLEKYPGASKVEFPAVLLTSMVVELGPQQAGFILEKNTGCPIVPAVMSPIALKDAHRTPAAGELSWKVAALFGTVSLPETVDSCKDLWERMNAVNTGGRLRGTPPDDIWPESVKPVDNAGKKYSYM